jgi:DNA-binding beta-propeller fold protein YncE
MGFSEPVAVALGEGDTVYLLNRGREAIVAVPWNRTARGINIGKITVGTVPGDEEFLGEFSKYGNAPGELIWPAGMALDRQGNIYVTDEWMNRVSIFDQEGKFLSLWGSAGEGNGEFNGPSGIVFDSEEDLYIVDSRNHRVQQFTKDGKFLSKWGSFGSGQGQFNAPWGITIDHEGYIYVADHKNDRVQKLTPEGEFVAQFGSSGTGRGQLTRPSAVAVDPDGDVYVCDWANNRVQVFGPNGKFITSLRGDAQELSKWAKMVVQTNPAIMQRRREVKNPEVEWRLAYPTALVFDPEKSRLLIADTQRNRLQIYNKVKHYVEAQRNL